MFTPWSPSPIAASSRTRWSRSARMVVAISDIQARMAAPSRALRGSGATSHSPAEGGRTDRGIPEGRQLVVQLEQGQRGPGHLQRRDVVADELANGLQPGLAQQAVDLAVQQI